MKNTILLINLLFSSLFLYSQEHPISLGFSGGTTISNIKAVNYLPGNYSYKLGIASEFSFKMKFNPHLFILSDIGFLQKGYNFEDESPLKMGSLEISNSYAGIELAVSHYYLNNGWYIGYQFGEKIEVSISAGVYYSYYLFTKIEDWNYMYVDPIDHEIIGDPAIPVGYHENRASKTERNQQVSNWDAGITGCIGLGYKISPEIGIILTGKYNHGLIDTSLIELFDPTEMYNRSFSILIGIELNI